MAVRPPYYLHLLLQHQPKHLLLVYFTASQPLTMSSVQDIDIEDDLIDEAFLSIILEQLQRVGGDEKPRQSRNLATNAGPLYLDQLLNCNHPERIKGALRMSRDTFFSLRNWLVHPVKGLNACVYRVKVGYLPLYYYPASLSERYYGTLLCWKQGS